MSYIVIRTIKGRQYRYRQRSYRDGGRVRTISDYLGPVEDPGRQVKEAGSLAVRRRPISDPPFDPEAVLREMEAREAAAKARERQVYAMLGVAPPPPGDPIPIEKPTPTIGALMSQPDAAVDRGTQMAESPDAAPAAPDAQQS